MEFPGLVRFGVAFPPLGKGALGEATVGQAGCGDLGKGDGFGGHGVLPGHKSGEGKGRVMNSPRALELGDFHNLRLKQKRRAEIATGVYSEQLARINLAGRARYPQSNTAPGVNARSQVARGNPVIGSARERGVDQRGGIGPNVGSPGRVVGRAENVQCGVFKCSRHHHREWLDPELFAHHRR